MSYYNNNSSSVRGERRKNTQTRSGPRRASIDAFARMGEITRPHTKHGQGRNKEPWGRVRFGLDLSGHREGVCGTRWGKRLER